MYQVKEKVWQEKKVDDRLAEKVSFTFSIPYTTARVLIRRGVRSEEEAEVFLSPSLDKLTDPFLIPHNIKGAERIYTAIKKGELICIYGDYDADGLCGTSLIYEFLSYHGAKVTVFIPHRIREGYGFHSNAVLKLKKKGVKVIITVDCGITAFEACSTAESNGIDVIITDHHLPSGRLPPSLAIISPHLEDSGFRYKHLSGAGVAFYFLMGLRKFLREKGFYSEVCEPNLRNYLDLVAVATVVDVAPLTGENRIMVKKGIEVLKELRREGLKALVQESGIKRERINTFHLSFILGPRLNAAGRVSDPLIALELLLTKSNTTAVSLARLLNEKNQLRQDIEREILDEAMNIVFSLPDEEKGIFLFSEKWHTGVIGIAASRLADKFNRPAVLGGKDNGFIKCSARSVPGIHITSLLRNLPVEMESIGGHESAAGFVIKERFAEDFRVVFLEALRDKEISPPVIEYDFEANPSQLKVEDVKSIEELEPFGEGNDEPVFLAKNVMLTNPREARRGYVYTLYDAGQVFTLFSDTPLKTGSGVLLYTPFILHSETGEKVYLREVDWRTI